MNEPTYEQRKFRRLYRAAGSAHQVKHLSAHVTDRGDKGNGDYVIVVKSASRSKGYASGYKPVLQFWCFVWHNGVAVKAWSRTANKIEEDLRQFAELGFAPTS